MNLNKDALEKVAAMNKSFDESVEELRSKLGGLDGEEAAGEEGLEKAKKGASKKSSAASESEEAESPITQKSESSKASSSESEEEEKPKMKKSIEDQIEDDPDAKAAIDVEPFLKSLVAALDLRIDSMEKEMRKSLKKIATKVNDIEALSKSQAKISLKAAELQKAMRGEIEKIGNTAIESPSVLRKGGDRFVDGPEGKTDISTMNKAQILQKSLDLSFQGKLLPLDVTLIEGRLNKGLPLDARHAQILADNMK